VAQSKRSIASDSLQKFQLQVLDLDNNNEVAGELGPLQYLSGLTGTPMDKIINWLLLIIIFVFDPLAISLVVAANFAFDKAYPKKKYKENLYGEEVELDEEDYPLPNEALTKAAMEFEVYDAEEMTTQEEFLKNLDNLEKIRDWEAAERRMEIIGQNGNDGEHYSELDLKQDKKSDNKEILRIKQELEDLKNSYGTVRNYREDNDKVDKALKRIKILEEEVKKIDNDDLTKIY